MTEAKRKRKAKEPTELKVGVNKVDEVVAVYVDGIVCWEQIVYGNWCGKEFIFLTSGGHASNLFNMRPLTARERGRR